MKNLSKSMDGQRGSSVPPAPYPAAPVRCCACVHLCRREHKDGDGEVFCLFVCSACIQDYGGARSGKLRSQKGKPIPSQ